MITFVSFRFVLSWRVLRDVGGNLVREIYTVLYFLTLNRIGHACISNELYFDEGKEREREREKLYRSFSPYYHIPSGTNIPSKKDNSSPRAVH